MKHFLKCKLFSVRRVSVYNPPVNQKISFGSFVLFWQFCTVLVLVMNETLLENNIVSLRLNYLLSTRQFVRDAFIYSTFGFVRRRFVNVNSGRL